MTRASTSPPTPTPAPVIHHLSPRHRAAVSAAEDEGAKEVPAEAEQDVMATELRWGVRPKDLRQLWRLHEASFPITYPKSYFQFLMTAEPPLTLLAFMTPDGYEAAVLNAPPSSSSPLSHDTTSSSVAAERQCVEEYINSVEEGEKCGGGAAATSEGFTVLVGLAVGQFVYARHGPEGMLLTNPSGYLGNFAVDPVLRQHGIGDLLLTSYLAFLTEGLPLRCSTFLHYDQSRMRRLLWRRALKSQGGSSSSSSPSPSPSVQESEIGWPESIIRYLWPEYFEWRDARRERILRDGANDELSEVRAAVTPLSEDEDPVLQVGLTEVWLHCLSSEVDLVAYYVKRGFKVMKELRQFYEIDNVMRDASLLLYVPPPPPGDSGAASATVASLAEALTATRAQSAKPCDDAAESEKAKSEDSEGHKEKKVATWLTPSLYEEVCDVEVAGGAACHREWREQRGRLRRWSATANSSESHSWKDVATFAFTIVNGLGFIGMVCALVYYHGVH